MFLIPFAYTVAEMLAHYTGEYKNTYSYKLFLFVLDRIKTITSQTNQMPKE
jgi:hypothetical protein